MTDKSVQKRTIMDYLPEHERAKVRKLVQRLAQQTQEKQKFKKLYEQTLLKYEQLKKRFDELEQYNNDLKSQIATSRMAISKAQQIASKSAKKLTMFNLEEQKGELSAQSKKDALNLKQTWLKIPKPDPQMNQKTAYMFEQNDAKAEREDVYPQIPLPPRTQESALKRTSRNTYRNEAVQQSSSKKQEIKNLKKEIQQLTEQMKKKQNMGLPLNEKIRKCEQIKNRYLKSKQKKKTIKQSESENQYEYEVVERTNNKKKRESEIKRSVKATSKEQQFHDQQSHSSMRRTKKAQRQEQYDEQDEESLSNMESDSGENEEQQITRRTKKSNNEKHGKQTKMSKEMNRKQKKIENENENGANYQRQVVSFGREQPRANISNSSNSNKMSGSLNRGEENGGVVRSGHAQKGDKQILSGSMSKHRNEPRKKNNQSQHLDQSLSALIDQLNFKN